VQGARAQATDGPAEGLSLLPPACGYPGALALVRSTPTGLGARYVIAENANRGCRNPQGRRGRA
jgi:hypothetical protein